MKQASACVRTLALACALGGITLAGAQAPQGVPLLSPPLGSAPAKAAESKAAEPRSTPRPAAKPAPVFVGPYRVINWDELVPAGWDPMKEFKDFDIATLNDSDVRALRMLKRMREVWDNAPANAALEGQSVRIPGFVVPLEETKDGLKEFLLVPYFGACIHSPPPPANQIVHVLPQTAAKGVRSMDAVWISGVMRQTRTDSYMGASSYRIDAKLVEPYTEKP
jgi:uncharacterized protein